MKNMQCLGLCAPPVQIHQKLLFSVHTEHISQRWDMKRKKQTKTNKNENPLIYSSKPSNYLLLFWQSQMSLEIHLLLFDRIFLYGCNLQDSLTCFTGIFLTYCPLLFFGSDVQPRRQWPLAGLLLFTLPRAARTA